MAKQKFCPSCKRKRLLSTFGKDRTRGDGLTTYCRECRGKKKQANQWKFTEWQRTYSRDYCYTPQGRYIWLKSSARRKGREVEFTRQDFKEWLEQQLLNCYYCGQELILGEKGLSAFTIDRKDNNKGYIIGNIVLACKRCNIIKGNWFTEQEMLEIADRYLKNRIS